MSKGILGQKTLHDHRYELADQPAIQEMDN